MSLSKDGRYLATCSDKGTLVRVFDASIDSTGKILHEFRRGTTNADIYSISFSTNSKFLIVNSDTFTCHIFSIDRPELNTQSLADWGAGLMYSMLSYKQSSRYAAKLALPQTYSSVMFISDNHIIAVSLDRSYNKFEIDAKDTELTVTPKGYKQLGDN